MAACATDTFAAGFECQRVLTPGFFKRKASQKYQPLSHQHKHLPVMLHHHKRIFCLLFAQCAVCTFGDIQAVHTFPCFYGSASSLISPAFHSPLELVVLEPPQSAAPSLVPVVAAAAEGLHLGPPAVPTGPARFAAAVGERPIAAAVDLEKKTQQHCMAKKTCQTFHDFVKVDKFEACTNNVTQWDVIHWMI